LWKIRGPLGVELLLLSCERGRRTVAKIEGSFWKSQVFRAKGLAGPGAGTDVYGLCQE